MIDKRTEFPLVAVHFRTRPLRRKNARPKRRSVAKFCLNKMRPQIVTCNWLPLLLIDMVSYGLTEDYKKQDFMKTLSTPKRSLMDTMAKKYSYPKNEVTAGVGYGHHLHPFYYQGNKEMMYPCAVECGEWETMNSDDSVNDASSNVEVVTVRPDVSSIDITTPKARPYKDVSFLRPKKYKSSTNLLPTLKTSSKTNPQSEFEIGNHPDSKGADVQIIPQKANNELLDGEKEEPNDGSLYGKYRDALVSGYEGELTENIGNNNEYINPVEESVRYNPPSFNDEEDNDDVEEAVYSNGDQKFHPKGKRIEEKYVKHNLREERLEGLRTNSFGTSGENEDYQTESDPENQSDSYDSPKYVDDYAAPKPYPDGRKPFRPSPLQNQASEDGGKYLPIRSGYYRGRDENLGSYSDYDYGEDERNNEPSAPRPTGAHFNPTSGLSFQQGKRGPNCSKNGKFARFPNSQKRPRFRGRYQEYPSTFRVEKYGRNPKTAYYDSHGKNAFHKNVGGPYPYAPGHGYSPQSQESPVRFSNGGIRLVEPPQRHNLPRHGRYPRYKKGLALPIRGPPRARGQKISYRHVIPHRDGFTKVVKRYKSFVDYTPKSYIGSGEPYPRP